MPQLIVREGPLQGLILKFEEGEEWVVGRNPDEADFVLEDSTVSRKHARIAKTTDGFLLKNLSRTNPTLINDSPTRGNVLLKPGDRVKIGHTVFEFSEDEVSDELQLPPAKAPPQSKGGYDELFGNLEEPELPPEPEPVPLTPSEPEFFEPPTEEPEREEQIKTPYDTIFEDSGGESDIPFNLLTEMPLLLKVIAGPNAGAEIGLEKGRTYTIGKDSASCEIVFQDLSVSRNHAKLSISPDGIIELEDLGSKNGTMVNGAPLTEKRIVTAQDLIAMGTTIFLIIDREAAQETIFSALLPSYERPTKSAAEEEAEASPPPQEEPPLETVHWKTKKIPTRHLIIACAFAAMFLIVFLSFFSLFKSEPIELVQKAPRETIKEALAKFPGVYYTFNPAGGKLFLAGHVRTAVDFQEMHYNLDQIPMIQTIEDTVVIDEGVSKMMNDVLSSNPNWRGVSIVATSPGQFIAHGMVQTNGEAASLSEYLTVNFPYLDRLQNKVSVEEILNTQIQGLLLAHGFGAVSLQIANGEVLLSGRYSEKQDREYKEIVEQVKKLDGVQSVKDFAVSSSAASASIDLTQQYRVTGSALHADRGYSVIVNGAIYTIGQTLDGMTIATIEPNMILLEKDGLKYKIDYTR